VIIGANFIFSGIELKQPQIAALRLAGTYGMYLHGELMRVVPTYVVLGIVVLSVGLLLSRMQFPSIASEGESEDRGSFRALLHYPHLWFAVLANFCNVGAQVATWSSLIPYMKQFTGVSERVAAGYLTATLVALSLGRFFGTQLMKYVSAHQLLGVYAAINVILLGFCDDPPGHEWCLRHCGPAVSFFPLCFLQRSRSESKDSGQTPSWPDRFWLWPLLAEPSFHRFLD